MIYGFLVGLHLLVSLILILVVLLQTGKSADLAGAFGGGGSQTAFGSRGAATLLSKVTTAAAIIFMITSFSLAILSVRGRSSVLDTTGVPTSNQSGSQAGESTPTTLPALDEPAPSDAAQDATTDAPAVDSPIDSPDEAQDPGAEDPSSPEE